MDEGKRIYNSLTNKGREEVVGLADKVGYIK
jgi:hypothetical protein